jgi:hypothetical protein
MTIPRLFKRIQAGIKRRYYQKRERSVSFSIEGTRNLHSAYEYFNDDLDFLFTPSYDHFKKIVDGLIDGPDSASILKFGDGDYFFLNGIPEGSAKPGKRALSKDYSEINLELFRSGWKNIDYLACEIPISDRRRFFNISPDRAPDFPAEYLYASIANRWLVSNRNIEIAVIGGSQKIDLIEKLQRNSKYREYLGIERDFHTIRIPQKFACDNIELTIESTLAQVKESKARLFLLGVGHAKSALLPALAKQYPGVFIDIGSGIDALAGVIDTKRPYFADWRNFQFVDRSAYSEIDYLQVQSFGNLNLID